MKTRRTFFKLLFASGLITVLPKGVRGATKEKSSLIHKVFFYMKNPEKDLDDFIKGCKALGRIKSVETAYIGLPADTERRDVVDHDFHVSLTFHFKTLQDHNSYQNDPEHLSFIQKYQAMWDHVKVYDSKMV